MRSDPVDSLPAAARVVVLPAVAEGDIAWP